MEGKGMEDMDRMGMVEDKAEDRAEGMVVGKADKGGMVDREGKVEEE